MYRAIAAIVMSAAVIIPVAPAPAAAAGVTVAPGGFIRDIVACPTGKVAVAGGAAVVGEGSRDFRTVLEESSSGGSFWLVAIRNNDTVSHNIAIYAVCIPVPFGYFVARKDFVLNPGAFHETFALCPEGTVVFGGGPTVVGEGSREFGTIIRQTAPDSVLDGTLQLWRAAVLNFSPTPHTIALIAVCGNAPAGYEKVRRDVPVAANGVLRSTVLCSAGKVVLGGGAIALAFETGAQQTIVQESAPGTLSGRPLWATTLRNGSTAQNVALVARCSNAPTGYQVVFRTF
ncbi:MAG TPA: hypothetical protein VFC19_31065 [Candidatus Limnocylindrales bacterium]|nr:hypothetical protein [Candidatus Limnocylindrales bacterium]